MPAPRAALADEAEAADGVADEAPERHVEAAGEAPADEVVGRCVADRGETFVPDAVWRRFPHGARAARWL